MYINNSMLFFSKQKKMEKGESNIPWNEKYRPNKVSDMVGQKNIINSLKNSIKSGNFPNLLKSFKTFSETVQAIFRKCLKHLGTF